ncbi:MAG: F0F1 ATP synthase subunit B [Bacilli bacterium]
MKKFFKAFPLLSAAFLLTSCDTSSISNNISDTIANALPNLWISLAQLGAFLVTVFIFFKFAYKPIKAKMKARGEHVKKNIQDAEALKMDAQKSQDIANSNIKASRVQANKIVQDAEKEAQAEASKIKAAAQIEIDRKREQGEQEIEDRKAYLDRKAHNEIVSTALDASKAILGREINESDNEKIINQFIDDMDKDSKKKESQDKE